MRQILRLIGFLKPYKRLVAAAYLTMVGSTLLSLAMPRLLGEAIDRVLAQGKLSLIVYFGLAMIALAALRGVFAFFENYLRESLAQHAAYDVRNALYDHLQRLSFAYHDRQQTGQLMSTATADVENVRMFISFGLLRSSYLVALIIAVSILLFMLNWPLAVVSLAFLPLVMIRGVFIARRLRMVWNRAQQRTGELGTILQESLAGIRVVKAFHRQEHEFRKFSAKAEELYDDNLEAVQVQASNTPLMNFLFTALIGLMLWFGGKQIAQGRLTPGELAQFILYLGMLQMPIRMSGWLLSMYSRAVSSGQRIFGVLDAQSPVKEKQGAVALEKVGGHVTFDHVSFKYDAASPVLHDVSFEAHPGEVVALLGATGSGKSTVVHLLPRFYDVTEGRVLIDGRDVRDLTLASLRRGVGIVQQDVFLFSATIRDNIAYGAVGATDEQVEWACRVARLHDFIISLPEGYRTWVGERGITLSGGQKQRVAIARTLLMDPAILVLDDSTSSVDTATEHLIRGALADLVKGRTTFVIAQRLSTVKLANLILVLDAGRIVQRGTHESLLRETSGPYRQIYEMQLRPQDEAGLAVPPGIDGTSPEPAAAAQPIEDAAP